MIARDYVKSRIEDPDNPLHTQNFRTYSYKPMISAIYIKMKTVRYKWVGNDQQVNILPA